MHYWRQENFQGLLQIADQLSKDRRWTPYVRYLRLREQGLRRQGFEELQRFITEVNSSDFAARKDLVHRIMTIQHDWPEVSDLVPSTLYRDVVLPTLSEWITREPADPIPLRWRSLDEDDLRRAAALDPHERIAREKLVARILAGVDLSIHELPNGYGYIGRAEDDARALDEAEALLRDLCAGEDDHRWRELADLRGVVNAYLVFRAGGTAGTFRDWAIQNDVHLPRRWSVHPYGGGASKSRTPGGGRPTWPKVARSGDQP